MPAPSGSGPTCSAASPAPWHLAEACGRRRSARPSPRRSSPCGRTSRGCPAPRPSGSGLAVRAFRVDVDQAHLHGGERIVELPVAAVALVAQPRRSRAPVDVLLRLPDVLAATGETDRQVLEQARIKPGTNILAVNLGAARKRLLAHPWIADAQINRKIPDGIEIRLTEQRAAAIIDVGRRFLVDQHGTVFKEQAAGDPKNLPDVVGLRYADLILEPDRENDAPPATAADHPKNPDKTDRGRLMQAVVAVLKLGQDSASVVPTREIRRINVDRQLGITLVAFDSGIPIMLGFDNYTAKYMVLKQIMVMLKNNAVRDIKEIGAVDLNDMDRVVVRPLRDVSKAGT